MAIRSDNNHDNTANPNNPKIGVNINYVVDYELKRDTSPKMSLCISINIKYGRGYVHLYL